MNNDLNQAFGCLRRDGAKLPTVTRAQPALLALAVLLLVLALWM